MITLYQFPPIWGLPNASPFCLKVETWLRMADLPWKSHYAVDPRKGPKGKFPFISCEGKTLPDSEFIIEFLNEKHGYPLDSKLSIQQKAQAKLLDYVFAERVYWLMVYLRWQDDQGWAQVHQAYFAHLPIPVKWFLPGLLRKNIRKSLKLQGFGRHSKEEIVHMADETLDAVAVFLGENPYFMGEEIATIDATAFGFLANIAWTPYHDPMKNHLGKHANLLSFCDRMWRKFYPERKQPFSIV